MCIAYFHFKPGKNRPILNSCILFSSPDQITSNFKPCKTNMDTDTDADMENKWRGPISAYETTNYKQTFASLVKWTIFLCNVGAVQCNRPFFAIFSSCLKFVISKCNVCVTNKPIIIPNCRRFNRFTIHNIVELWNWESVWKKWAHAHLCVVRGVCDRNAETRKSKILWIILRVCSGIGLTHCRHLNMVFFFSFIFRCFHFGFTAEHRTNEFWFERFLIFVGRV